MERLGLFMEQIGSRFQVGPVERDTTYSFTQESEGEVTRDIESGDEDRPIAEAFGPLSARQAVYLGAAGLVGAVSFGYSAASILSKDSKTPQLANTTPPPPSSNYPNSPSAGPWLLLALMGVVIAYSMRKKK